MARLLRITEVADLLSITPSRAYELARRGLLPVVRLGRQVRVDREQLAAFITAGGRAIDGEEDEGDCPPDWLSVGRV